MEADLEATYYTVKRLLPKPNLIDSLHVVKAVEEYRQFWKPKTVKVILLAESHVFTTQDEYNLKLNEYWIQKLLGSESVDYPRNFVRFVYCLGYGENYLLPKTLRNNLGTWQFWKIFSYCVGEDEFRVSKTGNTSSNRLRSKVAVLRKMRDQGIWLLDTSIVGLYRSGIKQYPGKTSSILNISWRDYVKKIVQESNPSHVIIIGKAVWSAVNYSLYSLNIGYTSILAPQARLSSEQQQANYEKYREICKKYC
jgi:hypothetical protein